MNSPTISYDETLDRIEAEMHKIGTKEFELGDFFVGGLYVRPVIVEPGDQLISKVHKVAHPFFLMAGTIEVYTKDGKQTITAPWIDITPAGTRRYARAVDTVLWCTIHATDKLTVDEVEEEVIEKRVNKYLIA
jgi:hypothetical protein